MGQGEIQPLGTLFDFLFVSPVVVGSAHICHGVETRLRPVRGCGHPCRVYLFFAKLSNAGKLEWTYSTFVPAETHLQSSSSVMWGTCFSLSLATVQIGGNILRLPG